MDPSGRSTRDGWWISGLLFLATMINYMDRQTLANLIPRITDEWRLTNEQYGDMELVFGVAFAVGSLAFGWAADRVSVRWLYPAILVAWSAVGFATGLTTGHGSMLVCRGLLGFFEAGHWPCALVVTQSVLARRDRVMGNSILQSGASAGAVLTPLVIGLLIGGSTAPGGWRAPFLVIGGAGLLWALAWWAVVPPGLLPSRGGPTNAEPAPDAAARPTSGSVEDRGIRWLADLAIDRRFWALVLMVVAINTSWQLVRAWLPTFLQRGRGYSEAATLAFNAVYFLFADVGCIAVGAATLALASRGVGVHTSRVLVFLAAALLAALTTVAAVLPQGWLLLATLLAVAAGTLGVFPCYYSFTQEISVARMGRVTGILSCLGWLASSPVQKLFGAVADRTGSYDLNLAILGWAPLAGLAAFWLLWPPEPEAAARRPVGRRGGLLRRLLTVASVSYLLALVFGTHYPRPEQLVGGGVSDKLLHFVAYAGLGGLVAATLASVERASIRMILAAAAMLAALAAADELTQPLFRRSADPIDWVFDLLGVATGLVMVWASVRVWEIVRLSVR